MLVAGLGSLAACSPRSSEPIANRPVDGGADAGCPSELCAPYLCDRSKRHCLTVCRVSTECAPDFVCDRGFCVGTDCTPETATARCGGYSCVAGTCSHDCTSASCTAGFYCRGDTRHCVRRCTSRDDVTCGGYVCDVEVGECEPYCLVGELACATGYTCSTAMTCEWGDAGPP